MTIEDLRNKKRITLTTLKAFARSNKDRIYAKVESDFDGMTDSVTGVLDDFEKTEILEPSNYCRTGIRKIYTVYGNRNYCEFWEDENFAGINVYNCCGNSILAVKKTNLF